MTEHSQLRFPQLDFPFVTLSPKHLTQHDAIVSILKDIARAFSRYLTIHMFFDCPGHDHSNPQ